MFLNNIKIRTRLAIFLVVPVVTLLYFSLSGIYLKYEEQIHSKRSLDFISVSLLLADLVHELQNERGLSAGYVGSDGSKYKRELFSQRKSTDIKLGEYRKGLIEKDPENYYWGLHDLFKSMRQLLDTLPRIRRDIDHLNKGDFFHEFSNINAKALYINQHLQSQINNLILSRQSDAYTTLLWVQERSGQERGLLNGVFSSGKLTADKFKYLNGYNADQERLLDRFFTIAPDQVKKEFRQVMKSPVFAEVNALQASVIYKASKNDLLNSLQYLTGYGGLIHNFKNYVIRGESKYFRRFNDLFVQIKNTINRYKLQTGVSKKEIESLSVIESTLDRYNSLINVVVKYKKEGRAISEIDRLVKVDDKPALDAIINLHKSVTGLDTSLWWEKATERISHIESVGKKIRKNLQRETKLLSSAATAELYFYSILTAMSLLLSAFLGYLLIHRLIYGVSELANQINKIQMDKDYGRLIIYEGNDEVTQVAEAFNNLINEREESDKNLKVAAGVFNNTNEAIAITDENQKIIMVNPAFTAITGYCESEVIGKKPSLLQSGVHDKQFYEEMWRTLTESGHWIGEIKNRKKNGELYSEMLNISVIRNDRGDVIMYIGMFVDITELKKSEEKQEYLRRQLLQAQKMESLGQLTGGIAHDFNNMLAAILGYSELADDYVKDNYKDKKIIGYLNQVQLAGNRAKQVVEQLLSFSRSGSEIEVSAQNISSLVNESIKMIRPVLPSTIEIENKALIDEERVLVNPVKIHQAIMNICINSRDSISGYGKIEFNVKKVTLTNIACNSCHQLLDGEYIEVSIADTGEGLDGDIVDRIFDPFFSTKEIGSEKGTGMGLSMVHGIMHEHHGHILIESEAGKGTCFKLLFELLDETKVNEVDVLQDTAESEKVSDKKNKLNILCVDDEEALTTLLEDILGREGYSVTVFNESEKALSHFKNHSTFYDVVITDQTMPKLTGVEMAQAMLKINADLPVILCSGYSDVIDTDGAETSGIKFYIKKPFQVNEILDAVNMAGRKYDA